MRFTTRFLVVGLLTGGAGAGTRAQQLPPPDYTFPTIIVTATRTPTPVNEIGSAVSIIDGADLRARGATTLLESLSFLPGLAMSRAGEAAGTGGVYLRGGKAEHLLVLVDGIAVNDPVAPGGGFDWSTLPADAIERIEVVRGPQSTLYGSEAIAGVLNIITRYTSEQFSPRLALEAGSFNTMNATAGFSGTIAGTGVTLDISRRRLGGISSADEHDGNDETDDWNLWSGALRLDRDLGPGRISATLRGSNSNFDIDDFGGPGGDDPNAVSWKKDLTGSLSFSGRMGQGWEHQIVIGGSRIHRGLLDPLDPGATGDSRAAGDYLGSSRNVSWHHTLEIAKQRIAAGIALEEQRGRSHYTSVSSWGAFTTAVPEVDQSSAAAYLQDQFLIGGVAITLGGRIDSWSDFGAHPTGRLAFSGGLAGGRLRGSLGTGFRAPGLYQRFSPDYGNRGLEAETSIGWDLGFELPLLQRGTLEITRYRQEVSNLIDFVTDEVTWVSSYMNRGQVRLSGWEGEVVLALSGRMGLEAATTFMEAVDELSGEDLVRRPDLSWSVGVIWQTLPGLSSAVRARRVGARKDRDLSAPPYPVIELAPVIMVDGEVTCQIRDSLALRLRLRNLTDASPVWVWGYRSMGRALYLGVVLGR